MRIRKRIGILLSFSHCAEGENMEKVIIIIDSNTTLILKSDARMNKEEMIRIRQWYKEHMDLDVKIIDGKFEIIGLESNGERMGKSIL